MITFKEESTSEVIECMKPLFFENGKETGVPGETLDPDWDRYYMMDNAGMLKMFIARDGDTIVGYCLFLVITHAHYKKRVWAFQDMMWFKKDYRGFAPVRFIKWCDDNLRSGGIDMVMRDATEIVDYGRVLRAFGYEPNETRWIRRFTDGN